MIKGKKTTVKLIFMYLILTVGLWMFLYSYTNSYNRLTNEKIVPAVLTVSGNDAELTVIGKRIDISLDAVSRESKLFFILYLVCPLELRSCTLTF